MDEPPAPTADSPPPAHRGQRRAMRPQLDRLSAEVWFASDSYRRDPAAVRRQRAGLVAYLAARGIAAQADDELDNSPAVQLEPQADLDQVEAMLAEWVESPD
jgi:hypothetical protein